MLLMDPVVEGGTLGVGGCSCRRAARGGVRRGGCQRPKILLGATHRNCDDDEYDHRCGRPGPPLRGDTWLLPLGRVPGSCLFLWFLRQCKRCRVCAAADPVGVDPGSWEATIRDATAPGEEGDVPCVCLASNRRHPSSEVDRGHRGPDTNLRGEWAGCPEQVVAASAAVDRLSCGLCAP